jgi:hypothetical protein
VTAVVRPKHRYDAETVLAQAIAERDQVLDIDIVAQALAEAEEYGVRKALHRLGPIIADAEVARVELAREVDL